MKKILITGATGFLGRALISTLENDENYQIAAVVRNSSSGLNCKQIFFQDDFVTFENEVKLFGAEIVVHLASYLTANDDIESVEKLIESNLVFGACLLKAAQGSGLMKFINFGTFAEYYYGDGNLDPAYFYSATKTAFRSFLNYFSAIDGYDVVNVIPYTIYGSEKQGKILDILLDSALNEKSVSLTSGEQVLDFIHIDDVISFIHILLKSGASVSKSSEYHVGSGTGYSLKEVCGMINEITNKQTNVRWGEKQYRPRDVMHAVAPISKNKRLIGWEPKIDLIDGIKRKVESWK